MRQAAPATPQRKFLPARHESASVRPSSRPTEGIEIHVRTPAFETRDVVPRLHSSSPGDGLDTGAAGAGSAAHDIGVVLAAIGGVRRHRDDDDDRDDHESERFPISGIAFSDTYPAGLVADQVGAYTCNAGSALFTGSGWSLSNVTLGAGASCSVPMLMHATTIGQITNTTSQVTGTGVPPGGPASAVLSVLAPSIPVATPALTQWGLALLALMLAVFAMVRIRHAIRSSPYDERRH